MTKILNETELSLIISEAKLDEDSVFEMLIDLPNEGRRKLSKVAIRILKELHDGPPSYGLDEPARELFLKKNQLVKAIVYATATLPEIKKLGWRIRADYELANKIITLFKPDWVDEWTEWLLEESPGNFYLVRKLYLAGFCIKPDGENYVLGMISTLGRWRDANLMETLRQSPELMEEDLWKIFSIEGGGQFSLAANEKYNFGTTATSWTKALVALSDSGEVSRERLLDSSLDALDQDFAQFRAGWFSRFHEALSPTPEERAERTNRYLHLLGSRIPPTATFALKALSIVNKKEGLPVARYMDHVLPAIEARTKSTVMLALRILESLAKNNPNQANELAGIAASGLIHESTDVQKKVLDIIDKYGIASDEEISRTVALNAQNIAPSLQKRLKLWVDEIEIVDDEATDDELGLNVADAQPARRISPIDTLDDLLERFSFVLENPDDPVEIESVLDGILRIEIPRLDEFNRLVGPLGKRAKALVKRRPDNWIIYNLAILALSYVDRKNRFPADPVYNFSGRIHLFFRSHFEYVADNIEAGNVLPLLSMPTHGRAFINPEVLISRYETLIDLRTEPPVPEQVLSLLRLDVKESIGESVVLSSGTNEFSQAVLFAMGKDVPIGDTAALWVAAACVRDPYGECQEVLARFGAIGPDTGLPASYRYWVDVDEYTWCWLKLESDPEIPLDASSDHLTMLFHGRHGLQYSNSECSEDEGVIRWAATIWPSNLESFFCDGSKGIGLDDNAQWHRKAFFEPLIEVDVPLKEMAILLVAIGLGAVEPGLKGIATDIVITSLDDGRLDVPKLAECMGELLPTGYITVARWTKVLKDIATVSGRHALAVRNLAYCGPK